MRLKKWLASFVGPLADSGRTVRDGKRALRYRRLSLRCEQLETRIAPAAVALQDPNGTQFDYFGNSVALSGSTVLVGAGGVNGYSGAAYLYGSSGQLLQTFQDPGGTEGDIFGMSVALSGSNVLVVGADGSTVTPAPRTCTTPPDSCSRRSTTRAGRPTMISARR